MVDGPLVWINGAQVDNGSISVLDWGLQRGDGCFEVFRSYDGAGFAVNDHLERLASSAASLNLPIPSLDRLATWANDAALAGGDCIVRILVTRGSPTYETEQSVVLIAEPVPQIPNQLLLLPIEAPWHAAGRAWELAGVKSLSYAPNVACSRYAQSQGFDDAILTGEGFVLEGPTFTLGWVIDGVVETPSLDLLILDSITRRHALAAAEDAGVSYREGRFPIQRLLGADEVFALSTIKEVTTVIGVAGHSFPAGPVTQRLSAAFAVRRNLLQRATRDAGQ